MKTQRQTLRCALAQINPTVGDLKNNAKKIIAFINRARELDADLVIFPEQALPGYPAEDLLLKKQFIDDNHKAFRKIVGATAGMTVILGCIRAHKADVFNSAAVIHDRKIAGCYNKLHLPNYGVFDEKRYFMSGAGLSVFLLHGVPIGITICEDIWVDDGPAGRLARCGAKVIVNISASPFHFGKRREREDHLKAKAAANKVPVVYVNMVGGQDEIVFDGGSMVIDKAGKVIAVAKQFEEDLLCVDLPCVTTSTLTALKSRKKSRRCAVSVVQLDGQKPTEAKKPVEPRISRIFKEEEEIYHALVLGTRDYVRKNGFEKVVLGLSGGIDSSIVAAIAADAIGAEHVTGIFMPSRYTTEESRKDAQALAQNLGIAMLTLPIDHVFGVYLQEFRKPFAGRKPDSTEENLQARIRGNILMAFSNKFGWLVLTTGNKSETSVGYCTLYGDMAGGFAAIKDVLKEWVYKIALYLNLHREKNIIPLNVIRKEPTAELRRNQRDTDTLPPYPVLDPILKNYIEKNKGYKDLVRIGFDKRIVRRVINLVDMNEYKRRQAPPGIKITPLAFGRDRRYPITNKYRAVNRA
jgi:NAD+ synthase (glutamine-hydrolysing)